jgi:hypothetical protein
MVLLLVKKCFKPKPYHKKLLLLTAVITTMSSFPASQGQALVVAGSFTSGRTICLLFYKTAFSMLKINYL